MSVTAKALIPAKYAATSVATEYTVPSSTKTIIDKFTATNITAGPVLLTVHLIDVATGAAGPSNMILSQVSILALKTFDSSELKNQILNTTEKIAAFSDTANALVIRASGREVTT